MFCQVCRSGKGVSGLGALCAGDEDFELFGGEANVGFCGDTADFGRPNSLSQRLVGIGVDG